VPPPAAGDHLLVIRPPLAAIWRDTAPALDTAVHYLRLTPADQAFLTRIGIRWRY
jgi:hypothetical protein